MHVQLLTSHKKNRELEQQVKVTILTFISQMINHNLADTYLIKSANENNYLGMSSSIKKCNRYLQEEEHRLKQIKESENKKKEKSTLEITY